MPPTNNEVLTMLFQLVSRISALEEHKTDINRRCDNKEIEIDKLVAFKNKILGFTALLTSLLTFILNMAMKWFGY